MTIGIRDITGYPAWLPKAARLYLTHTERGLSLREIARAEGCHPSTILRQVRAYENRRDDPLVDEALTRIGAVLRDAGPATGQGPMQPDCLSQQGDHDMTAHRPIPAPADLPAEATLRREARRVLRRLTESDAVLAVSAELDKAVVLKGTMRLAVVERQVAEAFAVKGWIEVQKPGRVTTYALSSAGRVAVRQMLAEDNESGAARLDAGLAEAPTRFSGNEREWALPGAADRERSSRRARVSLSESPVQVLARRRDKDGTPFLAPELVAAAERLREDFELAQVGPRVAQNWDRFLTGTDRGPFREPGGADGAARARDRVALALRDLGPGLGDVVLRCCCYLEGIESAEQRMGWSARSGKIVLRIALMRLRRHYDDVYGGRMPMIG